MANVPVGPHRVSPVGQSADDELKEPRFDSVAASSRSAGNSFKAERRGEPQKKSKMKLIVAAIVTLIVLVLVGYWFSQRSTVGAQIDGSKYQAVFFTNGQVYFGKLQKLDGDYYKLSEIYYIQEQKASENPQATGEDNQAASNPQLVKLGEEIHGPEDAMIINRDQVLFFENLKKDGKVTDVILKDRAQKQ